MPTGIEPRSSLLHMHSWTRCPHCGICLSPHCGICTHGQDAARLTTRPLALNHLATAHSQCWETNYPQRESTPGRRGFMLVCYDPARPYMRHSEQHPPRENISKKTFFRPFCSPTTLPKINSCFLDGDNLSRQIIRVFTFYTFHHFVALQFIANRFLSLSIRCTESLQREILKTSWSPKREVRKSRLVPKSRLGISEKHGVKRVFKRVLKTSWSP